MARSVGIRDVRVIRVKFVIGADFIMDIRKFAAPDVKIIQIITQIAMGWIMEAAYLVINA